MLEWLQLKALKFVLATIRKSLYFGSAACFAFNNKEKWS